MQSIQTEFNVQQSGTKASDTRDISSSGMFTNTPTIETAQNTADTAAVIIVTHLAKRLFPVGTNKRKTGKTLPLTATIAICKSLRFPSHTTNGVGKTEKSMTSQFKSKSAIA